MNCDRLAIAPTFGADRIVDPDQESLLDVVMQETRGQGADVVIIAAPAHKVFEQSLRIAALGGRINFFGGLPKDRPDITLDANLVHYKELQGHWHHGVQHERLPPGGCDHHFGPD